MDTVPDFLIPCAVIAAASLPMAFAWVPPNGFYGFRTRKTMSAPHLWYPANRFAGRALLFASALSAVVFVAMPEYASGRSLVGLAIFLVPLFTAVGASVLYVSGLDEAK